MTRSEKIAVLPGDGIGPEVVREAVKVLEATGLNLEFIEGKVGGRAYIESGDSLPEEAKEAVDTADAVLFGAVEHHYAPYGIPRKVLIYLRMEKDAYANVRPLKLYPGVFPKHRAPTWDDIDIVIIRDNAEGFALKHEGHLWDDIGVDKRVITQLRAQQLNMYAYNYAAQRGRKKLTCIDKSAWLYADKMFRSVFKKVAEVYPDIEREFMNVDVAAMTQTMDPGRFDVIVTPDIYVDILSGIVIGQTGGIGLAPSACIGEDFAFFEPVHGTAWDIAGKGVANPIASILSAKLMLEWLSYDREALAIEGAVSSVLSEGKVRTPDLGGNPCTSEVGDVIAAHVEAGALQQPSDMQTVEAEE
jgi:isocitrate/isopropylmalate dehydrogenase